MVYNDLEKLGFTPEEIKVYLAILELGGGIVSNIAKKAGTHRVTTYNTLENLEKKKYVNKARKRGVMFFYPLDPKIILDQIEDSYNTAREIIPELINLHNSYIFKPKIQFYEGKQQIWEIFKDIVSSKTEVAGFIDFKALNDLFPEYLDEFKKILLFIGTKFRILCPYEDFNREYIGGNLLEQIEKGVLNILTVNPQEFESKNAFFVYEDKIATISYYKDEMMGYIIKSKHNAETNRAVFNLAWLGAGSFVAK